MQVSRLFGSALRVSAFGTLRPKIRFAPDSPRGSPRPPRPPRLQAFSIPITACAARFSSKDGQQTIWFRGGLTVRISSSSQVSPALGAVLVEGRGQGLLNPPAGCRVGRKPGAPPEGLAATHAGQGLDRGPRLSGDLPNLPVLPMTPLPG